MYEISPYATFSMSGGATGVGAVGGGVTQTGGGAEGAQLASGTLRTFGRAEPAPLAAAPPRHRHKHRDPNSGTNTTQHHINKPSTGQSQFTSLIELQKNIGL